MKIDIKWKNLEATKSRVSFIQDFDIQSSIIKSEEMILAQAFLW